MSEGATQRSRTGPRSLISKQLIRAALRALINGPMEAGAASGRDGISCAGSTPVLARGAVPAEAPRRSLRLWERGPAPATLVPRGKPAPRRGGPRRAGGGALGVPPPNSSEVARCIISAPAWVTSYSNFGAQPCWLIGSTAARREGGLEGTGRGRARCTVKFNSLNIPLLKAAA